MRRKGGQEGKEEGRRERRARGKEGEGEKESKREREKLLGKRRRWKGHGITLDIYPGG